MRYFYDIGANQGQTFDWYLLKGKFSDCHVVCFEPSPRHLQILLNKMRSLQGKFAAMTLVPVGLYDYNGIAEFFQKNTHMSDSLFFDHVNKHVKNIPPAVKLEVPVMRLTDFISSHTKDGDEVLLKIDAEGAEFAILEDLLGSPEAMARVKSCLVEWHFDAGSARTKELAASITRRLAEHGLALQQWKF